jgi:hypothetical protein
MHNDPGPRNPLFSWVLVLCFAATILLPSSVAFFPSLDANPLNENRRLAQWPNPPRNRASLSAWPSQFETYYNDHFGFRGQLVRANNYLQIFLLGTFPARHVTVGNDGWLYFPFDGFTDDYSSATQFDEKILAYWKLELSRRREVCDRLGIRYLLVIAPNKQSIYPEFLPDKLRQSRDSTAFDRFVTLLETKAEIVDLRDSLIQAKPFGHIYQKTDSHWNDRGAFIAARECVERLRSTFPTIKLLDRADYGEIVKRDQEGGDLARLLGFQDRLRENHISFYLRTPSQTRTESAAFSPVDGWPPGKKPFAIENPNSTSGLRVVFTGDSFGPYLVPFLAEAFDRLALYWPTFPYTNDHPDLIARILETERPNVYIEEIVERAFGRKP